MTILTPIMLIRLAPDDVRAFAVCASASRVWLEKCGRDTAEEAVTALIDHHLSPFMEVSNEVQQAAMRLAGTPEQWSTAT